MADRRRALASAQGWQPTALPRLRRVSAWFVKDELRSMQTRMKLRETPWKIGAQMNARLRTDSEMKTRRTITRKTPRAPGNSPGGSERMRSRAHGAKEKRTLFFYAIARQLKFGRKRVRLFHGNFSSEAARENC